MAETALSVVAEEILGKLISLATEQISVAWGFKDELMRLRKSVEMIQDVLADAERRQVSDRSVMRWLQRLKDVAYDADDVLDELAYEVLRRKVEIRNHMKRKIWRLLEGRSLKNVIENFEGEKFPSWIWARNNSGGGGFLLEQLLKIRLENCNKCSKIPTLGHLPRLRVLQIEKMENVRCIGTEFYINYGGERSSHNGGGSGRNVVFPALKTLVLRRLPNLVEWKDAMELTTIETVFPCLEELNILLQNNRSLMSIYISNCSDLVSIPAYQDVTSLQSFRISGCEKLSELSIALLTLPSLETFEVSGCPNLRSFPSLQGAGSLLPSLAISCGDEVLPTALQSCMSLSSLSIKECPNLILIPELRKLHSLTKLEICDCPNLKSIPDLGELHSLTQLSILRCQTLKLTCLPEELEFVTRLKYLAIGGFCEELDAFPSLSSIQHLHTSLESLDLYGWAKLNSLPEEIQHFTSLEYLFIHNFDGLEALPEWLCNLSSLQRLELWSCENLMKDVQRVARQSGPKSPIFQMSLSNVFECFPKICFLALRRNLSIALMLLKRKQLEWHWG
nr:disease resistance protein tao1 [Quercus suber]